MLDQKARQNLITRLRRIEGQTQGIQRMLADERDCREVLHQLASVRAATQRVSQELVRHYMASRLHEPHALDADGAIDELIQLLMHA